MNKAVYSATLVVVAVGLLMVALLAALIFGLTNRIIVAPLRQAGDALAALGRGIVTVRMKSAREDEIGELAASLDRFADTLETGVVATLARVARGDLSATMPVADPQDALAPAVNETIDVAARPGGRSTRADARRPWRAASRRGAAPTGSRAPTATSSRASTRRSTP